MATAEHRRRVIRYGVLCDGEPLAGWQRNCLAVLEQLPCASAGLLILRSQSPRPAGSFLLRLYSRFVDRRSEAIARHPLPECLRALPTLRVGMNDGTALNEIESAALDFILDLGTGEVPIGLTEAARHGVWRFHFGDPARPSSALPGFWEIYRGEPVTFAQLERLPGSGNAGEVLFGGCFKTNPFSYRGNRDQLLCTAARWPAQVCVGLDERSAGPPGIALGAQLDQTRPSNLQMVRFAARLAGGLLGKVYSRLFRHQRWQVGIVDAPVHVLAGLGGEDGRSAPVRWLPNPRHRFLADPFAIEAEGPEGDLLLLAEDFDWSSDRGRISALRVTGEGSSEPAALFEFPHHMSYPFLFRHEGRLFCVPETNEAKDVVLYRLDEDGSQWTRQCVMVDGRRLADVTVVQRNGYWWLFATDVEDEQVRNLHVWFAADLCGPWQEHAANPVKVDVRSSRPAGRPFEHEGALYRPAQDCSLVYGGAVTVNKVTKLTPTHYQEATVATVEPRPEWRASDGLHHLCGVGQRTVIDACEEVFEWRALLATLAGVLGKFRRLLP